ncbi:MAG: ABC transporter permease [Pseudomonadota bacterium]
MYENPAKSEVRQGFLTALVAFLTLVYALVVRDLRTEHKNAALGIILQIAQPLVAGLIFYFFIQLMGGKGGGQVRGDFMTFVLIGFIVFFMHIRTVAVVSNSLREDMLYHKRLTPFLIVCVKALSSAYKMVLALLVLLLLNYLLRDVYEMEDPLHFMHVMFWCWLGGVAVGIVFMAANRYLTWGPLLQTAYVRVMFFTSGKFFVANSTPGYIRHLMDWNPLFHLLDQGRDAALVHYTARTTSMGYPIMVFLVILVIAMLIENYVRRTYSQSHLVGN